MNRLVSPHGLLRPTTLAVCLAFAAPGAITIAAAQATVAEQAFNIPAGPLDTTLTRIARQSGQVISIQPDLVQGLKAPAIQGQMSAEQAYREALRGSGLQVFATGSGALSLRQAPGGQTTLPEVRVVANAEESAWGAVRGYVAKRSATGTKTDTPIIEIPQSISVITADQVETLKPQNLSDALAYTAGFAQLEGADKTAEGFVLRGFQSGSTEGSIYRDGTRYTIAAYNGQQELYGLERIEVLKGASSVLFGTAAPGGIVNAVTKRPMAERHAEVNLDVGSFNRKQLSTDFGGALGEGSDWSYRITALQRKADGFVDYTSDDRTFIAPALKWQPSAATSLTLLANYQKDKTQYIYGLPAAGTVQANPNGRIPRERFIGEPGYDKFDNTMSSLGYIFEHAYSDDIKLRNSLRHFEAKNDFPSVWIWGLAGDNRTTAFRGAQDRRDRSVGTMLDASLEYTLGSGAIRHTLLGGFDYTLQKHETERYDRTLDNLDLYDPVYGSPLGPRVANGFSSKSDSRRAGIYLQDQIKIDEKWVVVMGGRQDWSDDDFTPYFVENWTREKSKAFTGRAGLVYLADNGLAPFMSFSQSFQPEAGRTTSGERYKPTMGEQIELGIRYQPKGSDMMLSAAVYELTKQNVVTPDPSGIVGGTVQTGEVRSRGVELEAKAPVGRHVNVIAAYAYTDATVTASNDPATPVGSRSGGVPKHQASLWGDYNFGAFGLAGLKAGLGVRYVDSTPGVWVGAVAPSFTVFDGMVSYTSGKWRYALNATNLADKTYIASCTYDCFYGMPRRIIASATYRW